MSVNRGNKAEVEQPAAVEQQTHAAPKVETQQTTGEWDVKEDPKVSVTPNNPLDDLDIPEWGGSRNDAQMSIASIMRGFGGVLATDTVHDVTAKVAEIINNIIDESKSAEVKKLRCIAVPASRTGNYDAVVVLQTVRISGQIMTGFHSLLIEQSNDTLLPTTQTINGVTFENILTVNDAYNAGYVSIIQAEAIAGSIAPQATQKPVACGYQSIYAETTIDATKIRDILMEATNSIKATFAMMVKDRQHLRLDEIVSNPNIRTLSTISLQESQERPNGLPIRSDIVTELTLIEGKANQQGGVDSRQHLRLSRVSAFVDLIYALPRQQQYGYQNQVPAHYIPRLVITDVTTPIAVDPLNAVLLSLANATSINKGRAYAIQWRDTYNKTDMSIRDIGAIGYQVPAINETGKPGLALIESDADLRNLVDRMLIPEMMYSIDIAQGGTSSWLLQIFARAGDGNKNANRLIFNAANVLTKGRFEAIFAKRMNMSIQDAREYRLIQRAGVFHAGYYKRDNERHDLRELDLLAVMNITKGDPTSIETYLRTLTQGVEAPQLLLDHRLRLFRKLVSAVYVKDYVTRYDFLGTFIDSLIEAISATGLVITPGNAVLTQSQPGYSVTMDELANRLSNGAMSHYQANQYNSGNNNWGIGSNWNTGYANNANKTNSW